MADDASNKTATGEDAKSQPAVTKDASSKGGTGSMPTAANEPPTPLAEKQSNQLLSGASESSGLSALARDGEGWHHTFGQTFGYDSKATDSAAYQQSETLRSNVANAAKTGDWQATGFNLVAAIARKYADR